jgi:hypothetical protein
MTAEAGRMSGRVPTRLFVDASSQVVLAGILHQVRSADDDDRGQALSWASRRLRWSGLISAQVSNMVEDVQHEGLLMDLRDESDRPLTCPSAIVYPTPRAAVVPRCAAPLPPGTARA